MADNAAMQKELYSHFSPKMYGICLRYTKNKDEAADLLQEGFIKVFNNLHKFKKEGSLEGWIRRIMINTVLSSFRKNHHLYAIVNIENIAIDNASQEDESLISQVEINEVLEIIRELPEGYQMVLNLYAIDGYSHKQIANQLGISESTSKSQLSRARVMLVTKLKHHISKKKLNLTNAK